MANAKKTGVNTHRATERGYAYDQTSKAGVLIEPGELIPAGQVVSDEWMEKATDGPLEAAVEEALDPKPKDVDLTQLSKQALEALAAERGINVEQDGKKLTKDELVTAIKAARANDAG